MATSEEIGVKQCFEGKNVLITGGTGFIGKVLIEKLLRTVPDIGNIYVFMRHKKGKTPKERMPIIFENKLFEKLKPDSMKKLIAIEGDVLQCKLGLCEKDRKDLIDNVNVIFHIAASIRFDDPLTYAILANIRFTRDIVELGLEAKRLEAFVHVSTAYCNADKKIVEEKLYPANNDWREAIRIAEEADQTLTEYLTAKYIYPLPNTYTYTKSLSEHVVNDLCSGKIQAAIIRPTMVMNVYSDPVPGWTDNLNGPIGLFYATSLGVLRVILGNEDTVLDLIPADAAVNVLIVSAFDLMKNKKSSEVEVYNNSSFKPYTGRMKHLKTLTPNIIWKYPSKDTVWYPNIPTTVTRCKYNYFFRIVLSQVIPALIMDGLLKIITGKPRLFRIQKKIVSANLVMIPFTLNSWEFKNDKTMGLESLLSSEDIKIFGFEKLLREMGTNFIDYCTISSLMVQKLIFKDENYNLEANKRKLWRLWVLDIVLKILICLCFIWFLWTSNAVNGLFSMTERYFTTFFNNKQLPKIAY